MILKDDFYAIKKLAVDNFSINAELEFNAAHRIYQGHFPGQPVTPGVCMMQMIKEIIEIVLEKKTRLVRADEMKFLEMIIPGENNSIEAHLKYAIDVSGGISVTALLMNNTKACFIFKGIFLNE